MACSAEGRVEFGVEGAAGRWCQKWLREVCDLGCRAGGWGKGGEGGEEGRAEAEKSFWWVVAGGGALV